jgi:hypothetical protein
VRITTSPSRPNTPQNNQQEMRSEAQSIDFGNVAMSVITASHRELNLEILVRAPSKAEFKVFVHAEHPSQRGVVEILDFYPTPSLRTLAPGTTVKVKRLFDRPLESGSTLKVGLFDEATTGFPRLRAADGRDHINLSIK